MHCPVCEKGPKLKPIKLNSSLPARKCLNCKGILIDLLSYRAWRDKWHKSESVEETISEVRDNSQALLCPKCSRLMIKYRIGATNRNAIDVCAHCDEAWLDEGEWELLGALELQAKLTNIFTEPWQRRLKVEELEKRQGERIIAAIGKEAVSRIQELVSWVENHPNKEEVLRELRRKIC